MVCEETPGMRHGGATPTLEQSRVSPRTKLWFGVGAVAAAFLLGCVLIVQDSTSEKPVSLFGVDGLMPQNVYGPVGFAPDAAVRAELRERRNYGPMNAQQQSRSQSLEASLGPTAAAELNNKGTNEALAAYRRAQNTGSEGSRTQQLAMAGERGGEAEHRMTASDYTPGRYFQARGSGDSLLYSKGTQEALKEMMAHQQQLPPRSNALRANGEGPAGEKEGQDLLVTNLDGDAGFEHGRREGGEGNVQSRRQALEQIKDMLERRVVEPTEQLSSARREKMRRVREDREGEEEARRRRGRSEERGERREGRADEEERRLEDDSRELSSLGSKIAVRKTDVASVRDEEAARAEEARDLQQHALKLEREEMAKYGQAEMARRRALEEAHRLLGEKRQARHLERKVEYQEKRAADVRKDAAKLQAEGLKQKDEFERLAGPVKKAQQNAKIAQQAYTAAELKLAKAETTAEQVGESPKLQQEAMARIKKLQEAARRMDELVEQTHANLRSEESSSGPLSGLESQFESPKKRAVRKLARAKQILQRADGLKRKEERLESAVKAELPGMDHAIDDAKKLHKAYSDLRREAEAAQEKADQAKVRQGKLQHKLAVDEQRLSGIKQHLEAERGRYERMQ